MQLQKAGLLLKASGQGHVCTTGHVLEKHTCSLWCHHRYARQYSSSRSGGPGKLKLDPGQKDSLELLHK